MKKLSILFTTYNRYKLSKKYIPDILSKVGNIDYEVLIWDNGSKDKTYNWLREYQKINKNISRIFRTKHNFGVEAINFLARYSNSKYILKVDDDIEIPENFAERLVNVYEKLNDPKLFFLGWDMHWTAGKNFSNRSKLSIYKEDQGKVIPVGHREYVRIHYNADQWIMNGVCRLSERKKFLAIGGHPRGFPYGVDTIVSILSSKHGYYNGFYCPKDLVSHEGWDYKKRYRKFKDEMLIKANATLSSYR